MNKYKDITKLWEQPHKMHPSFFNDIKETFIAYFAGVVNTNKDGFIPLIDNKYKIYESVVKFNKGLSNYIYKEKDTEWICENNYTLGVIDNG